MTDPVSLRAVEADDLAIFFAHQLDPEATRLAAFPSRDRDAFLTHWRTNILSNPNAISRAILRGHQVVGNMGAWTDTGTGQRFICYWLGREFWGQGIASAALAQFLRFESTRPLHARVATHNLGSIRVLEKAGFTRAGEDAFEFIYLLSA